MLHIIINYLKIKSFALSRHQILISRCACLGIDILKPFKIINRQKFRIDLPLSASFNEKVQTILIAKRYVKNSISNLVVQQSFNLWVCASRQSKFFIMDTYSELTDRKYTNNKINICCHRSDLKIGSLDHFSNGTLIDFESMKLGYRNFFIKLRKLNPNLKIIVILFPVKYDNRIQYKKQYDLIKYALIDCLDLDISLIELPDSEIHKSLEDDYPYHFDSKTIDNFRLQVLNAMKN